MTTSCTKITLVFAAVVAALSLTACGGSEEPKTSHVGGKWTIAAGNGAPPATWTIKSSCTSGPCDFSVNEGLGGAVTFKYDKSARDYSLVNSVKSDCLRSDGSVSAKNAITVKTKATFTPTEAKKIDGTASATAATIKSQMSVSISAAGKKAKCPEQASLPPQTQNATRSDD